MSFLNTLEGALNKGKAKLKEYQDGKNSNQQAPSQQYYNQQPQGQYPNHPQQYQQPQGQYPNPPQQYQQYQPPYQPPPQHQQSYYQPPSQLSPHQQSPYQAEPPPIPSWSKPQSPAIPTSTRPPSHNQPSTQIQAYWQPHFDPSQAISRHFIQETGASGWGNNESQNYTTNPQNCFFTSYNQLVLRGVVNNSLPTDKYTSARLVSQQRFSRQRGFLSATLKAPCAPGIWPAFWALPAEPFTWPNDGEVDIFESWNGDCVNHSCLHWGHFNGEDWNKHRVVETPISDMAQREIRIGFAWAQDEDRNGAGGRLVWYLDGRPVMKANIPEGTRRISDYRIVINIAMGGNVCQGKLPADGTYDFVVRELAMWDAPAGGWDQFGRDFDSTREGKAG